MEEPSGVLEKIEMLHMATIVNNVSRKKKRERRGYVKQLKLV